MIMFLSNQMNDQLPERIDPHWIVFLQKLAKGELKKTSNIWIDLKLGRVWTQVDDIVKSAYQWQKSGKDKTEAVAVMKIIYAAGMMEKRKREGLQCGGCGIPLAIFQDIERENGSELTACPNPECTVALRKPTPEETAFECPKCGEGIRRRQKTCYGCGARVDFSLPAGTITEELNEETTEEIVDVPVFRYAYGYVPYGCYDPWEPYTDLAAFALLTAVLLW